MNKLIPILSFLLSAALLFAQDAEPDEPGIVLPSTLLEVEDLQVEEISAVIPEEELQLLPEIIIPLPEADEVFVPEEQFDIPFPDQLAVIQSGGTPRPEKRADIFSEARISVGTMNHVRGDLRMYRLGPDPRFDLRFYHNKIDGYGGETAGSDFFHSDDLLQGGLSFDTKGTSIEVHAGVSESSEGLQQQSSSYKALTYRLVEGDAKVNYPASGSLSIYGTVGISYAEQILSSAVSSIETELSVATNAGLGLEVGRFGFDAALGYRLLNAGSPLHHLDFQLDVGYSPTNQFDFGIAAGVVLDGFSDFRFPVSASFSWQPSDAFALDLGGGYSVWYPSGASLRDEYLFVDIESTLGTEYGWFADANVQARLNPNVIVQGSGDFRYLDSGYQIDSTLPDVNAALFPVTPMDNLIALSARVGLLLKLGDYFDLAASWDGNLIGQHAYQPNHVIDTKIQFESTGNAIGAEAVLKVPLLLPFQIPELAVGGYYRLTESVRFHLDVSDILALFLDEGRIFWEPYHAPGFQLYFGMNISL